MIWCIENMIFSACGFMPNSHKNSWTVSSLDVVEVVLAFTSLIAWGCWGLGLNRCLGELKSPTRPPKGIRPPVGWMAGAESIWLAFSASILTSGSWGLARSNPLYYLELHWIFGIFFVKLCLFCLLSLVKKTSYISLSSSNTQFNDSRISISPIKVLQSGFFLK